MSDQKQIISGGSIAVLLCVGLIVFSYFDRWSKQQTQKDLTQVDREIVADAEKEYEIAKRSGTALDAMVRAGWIATLYLSAKDEANYQKWNKIKEAESTRYKEELARRAGLPPSSGQHNASDTSVITIENAKLKAVGTWTGTGEDAVCLRLVIRADGTYDEYTALIDDDDWGKAKKGTWEVFTDKYSDTGKRYYGLRLSDGGFVILASQQKMKHPNLNIDLSRGDSFPFSK
jgi:hypothetical protein